MEESGTLDVPAEPLEVPVPVRLGADVPEIAPVVSEVGDFDCSVF